ncbi:unnamed protein product [Arctia plantaginis]|uniref:Uncharacterized protein n=1 Tax=Arctia plantaginis TaxID=874455 RepID=A0A8S0ZFR8_ARCPL|nr:unnamed protein product [Arctia plantaginis]
MSTASEGDGPHIGCVDVNEKVKESESIYETLCDSGLETLDSCCTTFPPSDSEGSPLKIYLNDGGNDASTESLSNESSLSCPVSNDNAIENYVKSSVGNPNDTEISSSNDINVESPKNSSKNVRNETDLDNVKRGLTTSTVSLDDEKAVGHTVINKSTFSKSAENISNISFHENPESSNLNSSEKELNAEKILSQFSAHKTKITAVQKVPETPSNLDPKYTRIPKELLSQDIGNIVKNVHGIFSSVSGSLKSAYTHRAAYAYSQKPNKTVKSLPNGKLMNDIFEDENIEPKTIEKKEIKIVDQTLNTDISRPDSPGESGNAKSDVLKLQVESLERLLAEQRKENTALREQVKQQCDELQQKDMTFKELEVKLDLMSKRVEHAEREKDAAVMRYASVECAAIEARRAADNAAKAEKNAHAEVELLNGKLKSAHGEKQRICQLYDNKCHELMNSEREMAKLREDLRELDGRLKWTQSKLRMEMDAYKETSERADKLSQQVTELEAMKEAAAANATDSIKAKQFEAKLKESQAALILCRHERDELERKLTSTTQQLNDSTKERDAAIESLTRTTVEVEQLKISNLRLEEEAAELAALRAQAALADSLSAQLQRERERAARAEEALSGERAGAETRARREAAALQHAAALTAAHVAAQAAAQRHEAEARALSVDNTSLRERLCTLEAECQKLQTALSEETERRNKENRVLARKVAELTEEVAEANKKLEWEKGENGVLKKKHSSAIKELNRELQRAMKRCEQLEAKLPPPDANSTRTGSISSLSSGESAPQEERLQNGHTDTLPDIQV